MTCRQCRGIESVFDKERADKELKNYFKNGLAKQTKTLLEALKKDGIEGLTVLDIGGGVGAIQHELLRAGSSQAIHVDASNAYLEASKKGATELGYVDKISYHHGNFVDIAANIPPADIVTLDRVVCCYHDMPTLVGLSAARAKKFYGLVYPRDTWWMKMGVTVANLFCRFQRNSFQIYVHPSASVEAILKDKGFTRRFYKKFFIWQVVLYGR